MASSSRVRIYSVFRVSPVILWRSATGACSVLCERRSPSGDDREVGGTKKNVIEAAQSLIQLVHQGSNVLHRRVQHATGTFGRRRGVHDLDVPKPDAVGQESQHIRMDQLDVAKICTRGARTRGQASGVERLEDQDSALGELVRRQLEQAQHAGGVQTLDEMSSEDAAQGPGRNGGQMGDRIIVENIEAMVAAPLD